MKKQTLTLLPLLLAMALISGCTKSRKAELPESEKSSVFAISEFGDVSDSSQFSASLKNASAEAAENSNYRALDTNSPYRLQGSDTTVPARMRFMFDNLQLASGAMASFKITFAVDKDHVTAYKIADDISALSPLEKAISSTTKEIQLLARNGKKSGRAASQAFDAERRAAVIEKEEIKSGQRNGSLLVPLFKYRIESYGTLNRVKNELKEETSRLELTRTDWAAATHIQLSPHTDEREVIGLNTDQSRQLEQLYSEDRIDNQTMTAAELQQRFSVGLRFLDPNTQIFTRLDADVLHVYEVTNRSNLNERQLRLLDNGAGNQEVISCGDSSIAHAIRNPPAGCVLVLKADIPVTYKNARLTETGDGSTGSRIEFDDVDRSRSVGLVEIRQNTAARQVDVSGTLDPDSSIKISDIQGEFFYRRTFESASNMFLGRTGTSGDMAIVRFELEDNRIVVRNQQSLISYTGQGPKDREELMSLPVKYVRMVTTNANGGRLTVPTAEQTTKDRAEYAIIDWTQNTVPDATSPLAFYAGGSCFAATSSLRVTDADMRLATDGVLNYSLSGSYTVRPDLSCVAVKDVNSAYWGGSYQFNFNVTERISFLKHRKPEADRQFAQNISSMAQAAFNFGVFTLADRVTGNGTLGNRDGSEKYMPIIHDFRAGKKLVYHVGGLNNPAVTSPERRELIIAATRQVVAEWNKTLRYAFRGTSLQRSGDYVEIIIDEGSNTGHLGDLDRNYIWFQELSAENGLLGVAQPAANPRSGTIQAANVIVYSGNTFDQTEALLKTMAVSRAYEKALEDEKNRLKEEAAASGQTATAEASESSAASTNATVQAVQAQTAELRAATENTVRAMQLDHEQIRLALKGIKKSHDTGTLRLALNRQMLRNSVKPAKVDYAVNSQTFLKKLADIASSKQASNNPYEFELEVNKAFIQHGNLDEATKTVLTRRSEMLDAAIKFDRNTRNRPGCYRFSRNDINDAALTLDADPQKNLMLNFKKAIMSTLSHELGHAFGLLHNFKASTDRANYEFSEDSASPTGRNYSSIMDYIADIDMHYAGPGPYDAHAVRAAYTGMVEVSEAALENEHFSKVVRSVPANRLVSTMDLAKTLARKQNLPAEQASFVHLTKDSLNSLGLLKYYEQCDDTQLYSSALCKQFDSGGSAAEIVNNLIQDYNRGYVNRNYVYDKIVFGIPQKIQIINRNIALFQNIRSFLDETVLSIINGTGRTEDESNAVVQDQFTAAVAGYRFFHELLRTPDAPGMSMMPERNEDGSLGRNERLIAVPYTYKDAEDKDVADIKLIEARSVSDVELTRSRLDTVGIAYDKVFAMMFLLQSTAAQTDDDTRNSAISYINFEQWFLGVTDPTESLTMNTILDVMTNQLTAGFFTPRGQFLDLGAKVAVSRDMIEQTAIGTVIGLHESKWQAFDAFAEMFKISRASVASAPQDRFNVVRAGQDRSLSDTRVYFASQNALGASVLVNSAARNEFFMSNRTPLFQSLIAVYQADAAYKQPIRQLIAAACASGPATAQCQAARNKSHDDYAKEHPQIAAAKTAADARTAAFVAQLRELNTSGIMLPKNLDAEDSAVNFVQQVKAVRTVLEQIDMILRIKAVLESAPDEALEAVIQQVVAELGTAKKQNDRLAHLPLISTSFALITKFSEQVTIELQNGGKIEGKTIAGMMMNGSRIENDLAQQQWTVEKISFFTGLVDPDTVAP